MPEPSKRVYSYEELDAFLGEPVVPASLDDVHKTLIDIQIQAEDQNVALKKISRNTFVIAVCAFVGLLVLIAR